MKESVGKPTIAAVLLTADREINYYERSLQSILKQSTPPDELLIIDVGSDIDLSAVKETLTRKIISNNIAIKYIRTENTPNSRNEAIENTDCQYISFIDDDDEWYYNKLETQLKRASPNAIVISKYDVENGTCPVPDHIPVDKKTILGSNWMGSTSFPLISVSVLRHIGGFNKKMQSNQEWEMWMRVVDDFEVLSSNPKVGIKHTSPQMISRNIKKRRSGWLSLYKIHFNDYVKHPVELSISLGYCYRNMLELKAYFSSIIAFMAFGLSIIYKTVWEFLKGKKSNTG